MERFMCWTFLVILMIISLCPFQTSQDCLCLYKHRQTHFCDSDFVAVVNITIIFQVHDDEVAYGVEVQNIFKVAQEARKALEQDPLRLWSPSNAVCGRLGENPGKMWVVIAKMVRGQLYISLCGYAELWSEVTPHLREGYRQFYQRGCECSIWDTRYDGDFQSAGGTRCLLGNSSNLRYCQDFYGVCMPSSTGCSWMPSDLYNKCIYTALQFDS